MKIRISLLMLTAAALCIGAAHPAFAVDDIPTPVPVTGERTATGVMLSWPAIDVALTYDVYRNSALIDTVMGTTYTDTAAPATELSYFVLACDAIGRCSDPMDDVDIDAGVGGATGGASGGSTTGGATGGGTDMPNTPQNVTYTLSGSGGATITFDAVSGATAYLLHERSPADEVARYVAFTKTGETFTVENFDATINYRVSARVGDQYFHKSAPAVLAGTGGGVTPPGVDPLADAIAQVAALEQELGECVAAIEELTVVLDAQDVEIAALEAQIAAGGGASTVTLQAELATANTEIAALGADLAAFEVQAATNAARIALLEAQLALATTGVGTTGGTTGGDGGESTGGDTGATGGTAGEGTDTGDDGATDGATTGADDLPPPPPGN